MKRKKEELGSFKILSEKEEQWVRMDVEIDESLTKMLVIYAKEKMSEKELDALLINWSFNYILKKLLKLLEEKK
jgi:hypothetical protein